METVIWLIEFLYRAIAERHTGIFLAMAENFSMERIVKRERLRYVILA